jgi:hypothetical protein
MRALGLAGLLVAVGTARAEVSIGAQVGAGAQGAATYSVLEVRFDAAFEQGHVALGARGVWDDGQFRGSEWASRWSALAIVRDAAVAGTAGDVQLAAAAGALAPAQVGRIVDGYRVALDDRWRTGVRVAARSTDVEAGAEIDDVIDPRVIAASLGWMVARPWGLHASMAIDPGVDRDVVGGSVMREAHVIGEAGAFRRFERKRARLDVGAALVVDPDPTGVAYSSAAIEHEHVRYTMRGDVRVGRGGLVGPLYRVEGIDEAWGVGAGIYAGVASERGWLELGARRRPGLGGLYAAQAGAPMGRWVQAGAWAAVASDAAAGAAELRVVWSKRLFSALQAARIYRFTEMEPTPVWSVTAWFGAASL